MSKSFKEFKLEEDIIIPKGTVFSECNRIRYENPIEGVIDNGLVNSSISIIINEDVIKESNGKFKEI